MKLFDFQEKQVKELLNGFKEHRAQCLAWYTGAGKTNVFIEMCKREIDEFPEVKIGMIV